MGKLLKFEQKGKQLKSGFLLQRLGFGFREGANYKIKEEDFKKLMVVNSHVYYCDFGIMLLAALETMDPESLIKCGKLKLSYTKESSTPDDGPFEVEFVVDFDSNGIPCVKVARTPLESWF